MKQIKELAPEQRDDLLWQVERQHEGYAASFATGDKNIDLVAVSSLNERQLAAFEKRSAHYALQQTIQFEQ